jgi:hypothetical protein
MFHVLGMTLHEVLAGRGAFFSVDLQWIRARIFLVLQNSSGLAKQRRKIKLVSKMVQGLSIGPFVWAPQVAKW